MSLRIYMCLVLAVYIAKVNCQCQSGQFLSFIANKDTYMQSSFADTSLRLDLSSCHARCTIGCIGINYNPINWDCIILRASGTRLYLKDSVFYEPTCSFVASSTSITIPTRSIRVTESTLLVTETTLSASSTARRPVTETSTYSTTRYPDPSTTKTTLRPTIAPTIPTVPVTASPTPASDTPGPGPVGAGSTGATGPSGPGGPAGEKGRKGDSGLSQNGLIGFTGATGPAGGRGATGAVGPPGPQGVLGSQGSNGRDGVKGDIGPTGRPGPEGPGGIQGRPGVQGPLGSRGFPGATGPTARTGATGARGRKGANGPFGPTGRPGATGLRGPTGLTGATGFQGHTGPRGPKGDRGFEGPNGLMGSRGFQGVSGQRGTEGESGATGHTGPFGPSGAPGRKGDSGNVAAVMAALVAGDEVDKDIRTATALHLGCERNNNGGCEQDCVDSDDSYYCTCRPGYSLLALTRTCTACEKMADVVIMADTSDNEFSKAVLPLLAKEIAKNHVGENANRLALMEVGSDVQITVGLDDVQTLEHLEKKLLNLKRTSGSADFTSALTIAHAHVYGSESESGRGRAGIATIWIIVVSDLLPNLDLRKEAFRAKNAGATLVVITTGSARRMDYMDGVATRDLEFKYDQKTDDLTTLIFRVYEVVENQSTDKCQEAPDHVYCRHLGPGGSLYCFCRTSQDGVSSMNGTQCADIDECSHDNGGCDQRCDNVIGSYRCRCGASYVLQSDMKTCQPRLDAVSNATESTYTRAETLSVIAIGIALLNTVVIIGIGILLIRRQNKWIRQAMESPAGFSRGIPGCVRDMKPIYNASGTINSFDSIESKYSATSTTSLTSE